MNFNKGNNENKIAQIRVRQQEKELEKIVILADKKIGWIVFWSIFSIGAYIYTAGWKLLFILISSFLYFELGMRFIFDVNPSIKITIPISLIDNILAVNKARNRLKELS